MLRDPGPQRDVVLLPIRGGEIDDAGSWIYAWIRAEEDRRVVYVGATGLPPQTRAWLHLHDPDPDVGRIVARYPAASTDSLDVLAMAIPAQLTRAAVRETAITELAHPDLLSDRYIGERPAGSGDVRSDVADAASGFVAAIRAHIESLDGG